MLPDRVSNPGPLTYESGALPIQESRLIHKLQYARLTHGKGIYHHSCAVCENDDLYWMDCCVLHDCFFFFFFFFFFVIMYICIYVVLQRASRKIGSPIESPS